MFLTIYVVYSVKIELPFDFSDAIDQRHFLDLHQCDFAFKSISRAGNKLIQLG